MCGGVIFQHNNQVVKTYFPNPEAQLPVLNQQGDIILLPWGRRKEQNGQLPMGGWARLESIKQGTWDKYFPIPVKLMVQEFMEKDLAHKQSAWFSVNAHQFIQGLVAQVGSEQRVYVVTVPPNDPQYHRWPRVLNNKPVTHHHGPS